ncbi:hypothetical protein VTK26DRAFT_5823 [Humicola hyalothermophila]
MASTVAVPARDSNASGEVVQKPKRVRTSKPKVKTGCNNCKQRRIKCDEKRPECANCIRSKKICSGYPPPPRSARPFEQIKIAPKPLAPATTAVTTPPPIREPIQLSQRRVAKYQRRNTPPLTPSTPHAMMMLYHPSINLPFSDQEGQYFHLFREQTASELSGFFDSGFWTRSVLQECHVAPAIRHAVVALGALYKTLEKSNESPRSSPDGDPRDSAVRHWEMAFRQYSHACTALVKTEGADTTSNRTRLMASILLACFDSFVGDHKQAIVQIQTGLGLLEQLRAERRRSFYATSEEPAEEELTQMFTRLAIQAKSYDMAFHFPEPWVVRLTNPNQRQKDPTSPSSDVSSPIAVNQDAIPDRFTSVMEARVAWDKLCDRIFRFTETMFAHAQNGVMGVLPASLQNYGISFKKDIESWSRAFEHILASRTAPGISSQEKAAIAVLKSFQIMTTVLFMMTFSDSELHFDNFIPYFKAIVDLALEVVGDEERRAAAKRCPDPSFCHHQYRCQPDIFGGHAYAARHIKPSFSADLGIVPPLYVVATKCREPTIRRQAIQLLRSSARREGMWDSELTARIGMWIAEVEEEGLELSNGCHNDSAIRTPGSSPVQAQPSPSRGSTDSPHPEFDNAPLGPGSNSRTSISPASSPSPSIGGGVLTTPAPHTPQPSRLQEQKRSVIPEEKRVMVRAVEFDLRERSAVIQLGSRNLKTGTPDLKTRVARITW